MKITNILNIILHLLLVSYSNSIEISIEFKIDNFYSTSLPYFSLISQQKKYYYIFLSDKIFIYNYVDNSIISNQIIDASDGDSIGYNNDLSSIYIFSVFNNTNKCTNILQSDEQFTSSTGYFTRSDNLIIKSIFYIGNSINDWRLVCLDTSTTNVYFYDFTHFSQDDQSYLAYFDSKISFDLKSVYFNYKIFGFVYNFNDFSTFIIHIDKINNSNQISNTDMDYFAEYQNCVPQKIYIFVYSKPLFYYKCSTAEYISDFYGRKVEISNGNFDNNIDQNIYQYYVMGEINKNQYYFCGLNQNNKNVICNFIPYNENILTEGSFDLVNHIYLSDLADNTLDYEYLISNENGNGMIINRISNNGVYSLIRILDPTIISKENIIYDENFSGTSVTIKLSSAFTLDIYDNYYIKIDSLNGNIYLNLVQLTINSYYMLNSNSDELTFIIEDNVELELKFTLYFGEGIIKYDTFIFKNELTTIDEKDIYDEISKKLNILTLDIKKYISDNNIYKTDNGFFQVYNYSNSENIEKISNDHNLSVIKFTDDDISNIKKKNGLSESDEIVIIKADIIIENYPVSSFLFLIYDQNGNILDTSSISVNIEKPILNVDYLNLDRAKYLSNKLINMYNSSDPFYNDICFKFSSEVNGKDVTLKDRRNEYYVNITFCEDNCEYSYFDYVNVKVVCNCQLITELEEFNLLSFNKLKNAFISNIFSFNFRIIKCYKLVFDIGNYDNVGAIFIFIFLIISIVCVILYYKYHNMQPVKKTLETLQPSIKENENDNTQKLDSLSKVIVNIESQNTNKRKNEKLTLKNNFFNNSETSQKQNDIIDNENKKTIDTKNDFVQNENESKEKKELSKKEIIKKKEKINKLHYNYSQLEYDEALLLDKRKFIQIYWDYLLQSQLILNHFYVELVLELRYIKIIVLVIDISSQFFFNCFFYTDEYISDVYHRNAVISFFSDLPKVIYSILISFFVNTVLKFLSDYNDSLIDIIFEEDNYEIFWEKSEKILKNFYYRINVFIIIVFIFQLFFLYYCTCFCAVYPNIQKLLLFSIFQDILINLLLPFILCLFLAFLRWLAISKKKKKLYIFVGLLDYLV